MAISDWVPAASLGFLVSSAALTWLWNHGKRLYGVELRIEFVEEQQRLNNLDIRTRLASIEAKLDRAIEREIHDNPE